jgi:hypothetical protein
MGAMLSAGEMVYYRLLFDKSQYHGRVVSDDTLKIVVKTDSDTAAKIPEGRYVVISLNGGSCYSQVVHVERNMITLQRLWEEKREYFRVDDVIPLSYTAVNGAGTTRKARVVPVHKYSHESLSRDAASPEEGINELLWKQLQVLDAKLDLILERLNLRDEGFLDVEHTEVNLSGSGIRFVSREPFDAGTLIELKLRLPLGDGVVCYGNVVRSLERKDGTYEVALNFSEMDDEVREKIIYHVLDRQRRLVSSPAHRNGTKPQGETSDRHNLQ